MNKIPGNKSNKVVKTHNLTNLKTLMKQIEDSTNKLKDIWCSRIGRFNAVKMFILLNQSTDLK